MIKLLVVDDHPVVREGLAAMLATHHSFAVIGSAANGQAAVRLAANAEPDVILMDLRMPKLDGITAIQRLRAQGFAGHILVLTTFDDDHLVAGALRAGADGYVLKGAGRDDLVRAITAGHWGETPLDPQVAGQVVGRARAIPAAELTARELAVLRLLATGAANKEIAAGLAISENTIKTHLSRIFGKLSVVSRTEAVTAALAQGLITLPGNPAPGASPERTTDF